MKQFLLASAALFLMAVSASGNEVVSENTCEYKDVLSRMESGGDYTAVNQYGYAGRYQFGEEALIDTGYKKPDGSWSGRNGVHSLEDWKNNAAAQEDAMDRYTKMMSDRLQNMGISQYLGQSIPASNGSGCGQALSMVGASAAAHLLGQGGAMEYLKSGGFCGKKGQVSPTGYVLKENTTDGNGVCASKYMCAASGCDVIQKDMSKETCKVTMPMIEAINCSNMPASVRGFCQTYRPYLMTRGECESAEAMSKGTQMGPNKEACENLSFGPGTGSWSFVLACSWASDFVADQDGRANPKGPVSDPECIRKLESMGVQYRVLGTMQNGSANGYACTIENAVSVRGSVVDYGGWRTMTCDMALAMAQFDRQVSSLGVTAYEGMGSTVACRPKRDGRGNLGGSPSEHGLGRAVDIPKFRIGGRTVSAGALLQPGTPDGQIMSQIKQSACGTFRGVLSPTYQHYIGVYEHFHVEWGALNGVCR